MEELDKRLKRIEEMFSISRKNQPIKIGQMNANNERIDKIEERIVRIELEFSGNQRHPTFRKLV